MNSQSVRITLPHWSGSYPGGVVRVMIHNRVDPGTARLSPSGAGSTWLNASTFTHSSYPVRVGMSCAGGFFTGISVFCPA